MTTSLIESCQIAPPPETVAEQSLPLTFFDIFWLHFHSIRRLLFYEFPCSKPYFLDTLVPKLKHSLSLTLEHYFPLAGKLVYPLGTDKKPTIRYLAGDSVPLTISESTYDFDNLVGNQARDADAFYDYIPQLPPPVTDDPSANHKLLQVLALQVTLFPGRGICIGFTNHHVIGDANSIGGFIRSWASICKLGGVHHADSLPLFDRSLVNDPLGVDSIFWNQMKELTLELPSLPLPTKRVRATYVLNQPEIKKLKDLVVARFPGIAHASSFVVISAYVWTCLTKALIAEIDDVEEEFFLFAVDCRARLDPPLPGNYFGNCLGYGLGKIRHHELVGTDGFYMAAKAIADDVVNKVNDKEKIVKGVENMITEIASVTKKHWFGVSGSAKVDLYSADFGWGKARKMETLSIDGERYTMSLCKSRDCEGGFEVGLSLPKAKMDAFAALFADGLKGF
ncbi:anthocyanidin 3-o-glucoside 6''-o-acyltransferase [Phtheirospermum japonicum]|uniref:Anthocyanidin 3-o-glucoside 6''-o-acyltransferase n=1 Tax=Phtheirospermum japonicum TaxID=374723 RepID=A0A830DHM9_9LAMI|nr:anthocyanidin 3-o-glucoside 6''-o-acyltransferase [Phtheirospermum japonicum]